MSPGTVQRRLIVFPTELSLRRYQQEQALASGFADASGHTTIPRLLRLCIPGAQPAGRRMTAAQRLLLQRQAAAEARRRFDGTGPLGKLSDSALTDVLEKLNTELAALPEEAGRIVAWLMNHPPGRKLYQLGMLHTVWREMLHRRELADQLDINSAVLRLLRSRRAGWPPLLRSAQQAVFRSVRWFNPFEEALVAALRGQMDVLVHSALPSAHAEKAEDRLGQRIRSEIMGQPWAGWTEDLGDALATDSPDVLQSGDARRISFSRSAGAYGEMEDLARRIGWHIQMEGLSPGRIALVVPNIGEVQDIVPHVFGRFRIPYYFRRGRPVLSSPCVKAFLALLAFPLRARRDDLIDLVRNPAIRWSKISDREQAVADFLRQKPPPRIDPEKNPFFQMPQTGSGAQAGAMLKDRIHRPDDYFNAAALDAVAEALDDFGQTEMPLRELIDLIEELLEDATVRPQESHEQGVWVLNPHDAVGLDFDVVLFAGLNEGGFPALPLQDALLSDGERMALRRHLLGQGCELPKLALPSAAARFEQQSVLFLGALGMARGHLVLSYQSVDQEGNEKGAGEFYRKIWNLAGWGAQDEIVPGPYDLWRIGRLGSDSVLLRHWQEQQSAVPEDRIAMPGESFLPVVPLPLCRARDEALQAAVQNTGPASPSDERAHAADAAIGHLAAMLAIEKEREEFLRTPVEARSPSIYCGHIPALKQKVIDWFSARQEFSPTALEALAQCRYMFLLERIIGAETLRAADDMPDPMDRGGLIHEIMHAIYSALAGGASGIDTPRCWAIRTGRGWRRRNEPGAGAIPLAVFAPEYEEAYFALADRIAAQTIERAEREERGLGHPGIWAAEKEKVLAIVRSFVRYDLETAADEARYPALFETRFGKKNDVPAVELRREAESVRLHGRIDRIDLLFAETGELKKVRVLDYKGASRARDSAEEYSDEIRRNLNCQLPVYAFAAQRVFFGECNTPAVNALTEAGYLFCQRDYAEIGKTLGKSLIPLDEPGLVEVFLDTLFGNLRRLKAGDFSVDPLIEGYNDCESICRTEATGREEMT